MEQLTDLLKHYRNFYSDTEGFESAQERARAEELATLASDTFNSMFRDRLTDPGFLTANAFERVLQAFRNWIEDARPTDIATAHNGLNKTQCADMLRNMSSECETEEKPAIWPYVRKIR
jgi:hypothetical protein